MYKLFTIKFIFLVSYVISGSLSNVGAAHIRVVANIYYRALFHKNQQSQGSAGFHYMYFIPTQWLLVVYL